MLHPEGLFQIDSQNSQKQAMKGCDTSAHRVYRVPEFLAGRLNWLPPPHSPQTSVSPSLQDTHSLARKGVGGANSDEGAHTLVLY
jgi:hypothetical protein